MNIRDLFLRIRALVAPHRVERELDEELAFHIERETQKHIAAGLSPTDARTRARARFGPVPLAADQCRDARGTNVVDDLTRDILYAFRTFRRAPLTAITIVATVALGLGLITVVFTIYNLAFLRLDAVRRPGRAVCRGAADSARRGCVAAVHAGRIRRDSTRDRRVHRCFRHAAAQDPHRRPPGDHRPRHWKLLPGAGSPRGTRPLVDAG